MKIQPIVQTPMTQTQIIQIQIMQTQIVQTQIAQIQIVQILWLIQQTQQIIRIQQIHRISKGVYDGQNNYKRNDYYVISLFSNYINPWRIIV